MALGLILVACNAVDDHDGRERALALVRDGRLPPGEGDRTVDLPDDLDHVSAGGEVSVAGPGGFPVEPEDPQAIVVFFQFRGLNHYTGWVHSPEPLSVDPLGGRTPVEIAPLGGDWYFVSAG